MTKTIKCYHVVDNTKRARKEVVIYQDLFTCSAKVAPTRKNATGKGCSVNFGGDANSKQLSQQELSE